MRILILLFGVSILQTDFATPLRLQYIDLSDDGLFLAGIGTNGIAIINTETEKVVAKYPFEGYDHLLNIRISGNGKHLVWTRKWELFTADFLDNEIINVAKIPNARAWVDLEINYDGSRILATVDYPRNKEHNCDPNQRLILEIKKTTDSTDYQIIGTTSQPCFWLNNAELLSDGGVILQQQEALTGQELQIIEGIPDGENWHYRTIESNAKNLVGQAMTENNELLTTDYCTFFINKKNKNGVWEKEVILPPNDVCVASWYAAISPDGKNVVWLRNYMQTDGNIQYSEFWITRKVAEKWTTAEVFISTDEPRFIHNLSHFRLSNTNFAFAEKGGNLLLMPTLDGKSELIKVEEER
jgi:hypothetical protein